ncbi:MAG TPA: hypothetical protein VM869_21265 [Enhygromyxa sp.]|nr:hypothetical protein [Enhygromyxa sp.]
MTSRTKPPKTPKTLKAKTNLKAGCISGCFQHNEKLIAKRTAKPALKVKTALKAGCMNGCFQHNEKLIAKR